MAAALEYLKPSKITEGLLPKKAATVPPPLTAFRINAKKMPPSDMLVP
jgi:hypothetical protein